MLANGTTNRASERMPVLGTLKSQALEPVALFVAIARVTGHNRGHLAATAASFSRKPAAQA